jgi:hypothetical protein
VEQAWRSEVRAETACGAAPELMDTLAEAEKFWKQGNHDGVWLALEELA